MERSQKSWGTKVTTFQNDLCEVSLLDLNAGQRCSWHRHRAKWNQFYVLQGSIDVWTEDGNCRVDTGQSFTTRPMQWHEFRTPYGPAVVQEVMYVRYESEDIERETVGGSIGDVSGNKLDRLVTTGKVVSGGIECGVCGLIVRPVNGFYPDSCPECHCTFIGPETKGSEHSE